MKKLKKTNFRMKKLIKELSKKEDKIWKDVARRLSKPRRNIAVVNIARINRYAKKKESILIPGKVLGYGNLDKEVLVGAFSFSEEAKKKIKNAGGKCMSIEEFVAENSKGNKIRLFG